MREASISLFITSRGELARAFTEWTRRHREQPTEFAAVDDLDEHGQGQADTLISLLRELASPGDRTLPPPG